MGVADFLEQERAAAVEALEQIGARMVADIQAKLDDTYPPASEPGTPPHTRTGNLRDSISHYVDTENLSVVITIGAEYGIYLEKGTEKMLARPFVGPVVNDAAEEVMRIAQQVMRAYLGN